MAFEDRAWIPIVAERETASKAVATPFPCRGEFNRYLGCIGARRCRGMGVAQCILGRWPDERLISASLDQAPLEVNAPPPTRAVARQSREIALRPVTSSPARSRLSVGIVHADRHVAQAFGRQLQAAGYRPAPLSSLAEAFTALEGHDLFDALLVDGGLIQNNAAGERFLNLATELDVPVLSLPPRLRPNASAESAMRMATVWLTVTLRTTSDTRRAG